MGVHCEWVTATTAHPEVVDADTANEDYDFGCDVRENDLIISLDSDGAAVLIEGTKTELLAFLDRSRELVEAYEPPADEVADQDD